MTLEDTTARPTVTRELYSDRETFERELRHVFGRCWLLVGFESEIPEPGDYVTRRMGADPVVMTRDESGEIHVLHNSCTHRGTQVCKAAFGNSANFRCGYHGWTFGNDGALRGVPGRLQVYGRGLDMNALGLRHARVGAVHGLVFATFDPDAPSLEEYLGDFRWYLDRVFGFFPGGMEVYGGAHRVLIRGNWKIHAENFSGDGYHLRIAHNTMFELGVMGTQAGSVKGFCVQAEEGHALRAQYVDDESLEGVVFGYPEELLEGARQRQDLPDALAFRAASSVIHGTVFPNMTLITTAPVQFGTDATGQTGFTQVRALTPIDQHTHEVMYWSLVPKDAPEAWKQQSYLYSIRQHGASSFFEADDLENFRRIDAGLGLVASADVPLNYDLGVDVPTAGAPPFSGPCTVLSQDFSEANQRNFYRRYLELMNARDRR